jgi:hypothetical protein
VEGGGDGVGGAVAAETVVAEPGGAGGGARLQDHRRPVERWISAGGTKSRG